MQKPDGNGSAKFHATTESNVCLESCAELIYRGIYHTLTIFLTISYGQKYLIFHMVFPVI